MTLFYAQRFEEASAIVREVLEQHPNLHGMRPTLALCFAAQGDSQGALEQLSEDVKRNALVDSDIAYAVASVYALAGDHDQAFEWLRRSVALGNGNKPWFDADPNLASLRDDDRFKDLMRRIRG